MSSKLVVISDLHLWGGRDPLYRALLNFIKDNLEFGDKFFIVGDLFDLFVGNKIIFYERFYELINAIKSLKDRNIEVFYLEGNHDFHLETLFENYSHVKIFSDSLHYEWNNKKFYFAHGDKINWKDIRYQAFRFLTRSLIVEFLIESVPGKVIDKIGEKMLDSASDHSQNYENKRVIRLFRNYACDQITNGYDFVILGHSHFVDDIRFRVDFHEGQYINVGYPRRHRIYFELQANASFFKKKSFDDLVVPLRPARTLLEVSEF